MWNKPQQDSEQPSPQPEPMPAPPPRVERQAVLGPSITIKGSLAGEEDLLIEGQVQGEISFKQHAVTVGKRGRVEADLYCRQIYVEGEVNGNLYGEELVVVRKSANVKGNAVAPRVSLEDGSRFLGAIEMQPRETETRVPARAKPSEPKTEREAPDPARRSRQATGPK